MYEVVLLDADNTLFDYDLAEKNALNKTLEKFNFTGDVAKVRKKYKEINQHLWLELEKGLINKEQLKVERFKKLLKNLNLNNSAGNFSEYYLKKLAEGAFLLPGAEKLCQYLSNKYTVIIVTNGIKEVQLSRLARSTIKKYIEKIVVSEEVGVNKPDVYIFEYTLNLINHNKKDSVIMVGDSLTSDVKGGINYGIDTCWFNPDNIKNPIEIKPTYKVRTLQELHSFL